jgi:hypothetical protein
MSRCHQRLIQASVGRRAELERGTGNVGHRRARTLIALDLPAQVGARDSASESLANLLPPS